MDAMLFLGVFGLIFLACPIALLIVKDRPMRRWHERPDSARRCDICGNQNGFHEDGSHPPPTLSRRAGQFWDDLISPVASLAGVALAILLALGLMYGGNDGGGCTAWECTDMPEVGIDE